MDSVLEYDHFKFIKSDTSEPFQLKNTLGSIRDVSLNDVMSGYLKI